MGRAALWTAIRDTLVRDISEGHYPPGQRLPTEAQLSERFGVNRHTVRRAIADMAEQNIVYARRGAGVFVRHAPTPYRIGRRTRFRQNLTEAGRVPQRRVLSLETRGANKQEAGALCVSKGEAVHVYEGVSLSDGAPLALFCSVFPAARFPGLLDNLAEAGSVTAALALQGVSDYTRKSTEITAKPASKTHAALLELPVGDPVLRTVGINVDAAGKPVEFGRTWFAADRVTLIMGDR
ncbi:MAG: phosphonate metabolism transcriptional regulator PhnF [Pseudomonadota bacterium]